MAKKSKHCGYCEYSDAVSDEGKDSRHYLEAALHPGETIDIYSFSDNDEQYERLEIHLPMYYCPNCGRKLK